MYRPSVVDRSEVVVDPALVDLLLRERDVEVVVEIATGRMTPIRSATHARLVCEILASGARETARIVTVDERGAEPVRRCARPERSNPDRLHSIRPVHQMMDDELAAAVKKSASVLRPCSVSKVYLFSIFRQGASSLGGEPVPLAHVRPFPS